MDLPLRDIHLPPPISWWPLATGWWLLFGIIILGIITGIFIYKKYSKTNLRKQATSALEKIETTFELTGNASQCLSELSIFLRRVLISQKGYLKVAGLTGEDWLSLLEESFKAPEFNQKIRHILLTGPYQRTVEEEDVVKLMLVCRKWVSSL